MIFDKNNRDGFLNDLMKNLFPLSNKSHMKDLYHNFITSLSLSINEFSLKIISKNNNIRTKPLYDNECKHARREIKEVNNESLKDDKINKYKAIIKRKNTYYIKKHMKNFYMYLR